MCPGPFATLPWGPLRLWHTSKHVGSTAQTKPRWWGSSLGPGHSPGYTKFPEPRQTGLCVQFLQGPACGPVLASQPPAQAHTFLLIDLGHHSVQSQDHQRTKDSVPFSPPLGVEPAHTPSLEPSTAELGQTLLAMAKERPVHVFKSLPGAHLPEALSVC